MVRGLDDIVAQNEAVKPWWHVEGHSILGSLESMQRFMDIANSGDPLKDYWDDNALASTIIKLLQVRK